MQLAIEIGPIAPDTLRQSVEWVRFAEKLGVDLDAVAAPAAEGAAAEAPAEGSGS